jgi:hypothetical protein
VRADGNGLGFRQTGGGRKARGVEDQLGQATIHDALAVTLLERGTITGTNGSVSTRIDVLENPLASAELGNKSDVHLQMGADGM